MKQNESRQRKESSTFRTVDRSDWVETTTVQPRQRPKAGKALAVPQISSNMLHSSNPEISSQSQVTFMRQTEPAASMDLLGLHSSSQMSHSLDFNSAPKTLTSNGQFGGGSSNPFGDDFGKLAPSQIYQNNGLSSSYNDISNYSTNVPTTGFEDSFASLSVSGPRHQVGTTKRPKTVLAVISVTVLKTDTILLSHYMFYCFAGCWSNSSWTYPRSQQIW